MRALIAFLLLASSVTLGFGLTLPIMRVEKLWLFSETPSLMEVIATTYGSGDWLITAAVVLFCVVFPLFKLATVFLVAMADGEASRTGSEPRAKTLLVWVGALSKWSMMDVLLVALAIVAAKTSGLATAVSQIGLWFYAFSAISGAVAASLLKRDLETRTA
ncbi:MAG: paraquat-inducible protein A [Pseudomonadota bacterium]